MEIMLRAAAHVMSQEAAVLQLQQPCHVFGDIHGNFSDLKVSSACARAHQRHATRLRCPSILKVCCGPWASALPLVGFSGWGTT